MALVKDKAAKARRGAIAGGAALAMGLLGSTGAWAQCRDNFNFTATVNGAPVPVSTFFPLGTGSALSALTSTINTVNTAFLTSTSAFVSAPGNAQPGQQGGGAWSRVIAGTVDTDTSSVGTLDTSRATNLNGTPSGLIPATGTQNCNTTTRTDYWGYQVGHDISILNGGGTGANWHFGVTAGFLEARTKDITAAGSFFQPTAGITFFTPPGTFSEDAQVPFAGIYTAFTKGNFAFDAQARWDMHQNRLSEPINGLYGQELDARGFSLTGNAAYNIPLHNNWFVEPGLGVVWSRVHVNPLDVIGVQFAAPDPVLGDVNRVARGRVTIDDIESVLGRASVSVGTTFAQGGVTWQPFFTASVFHEFDGDVVVTSTIRNTNTNANGVALTTRADGGVGTYGQFALGTAAVLGNSGWLGYARTDYRIGDNVEGWSVNAGLRYQFNPPQARSLKDGGPMVYAYNWTGPYIGAFAGSTMWGHQGWRYPIGTSVDGLAFAGYQAGGQAGYNVQFGGVVAGVEGDYGFTNAHGGRACPNLNFFSCEVQVDNLASLTGRLGVTWGRALLYGKAGLAVGDVTVQTRFNDALIGIPPSNTPLNGETKTLYGWTAGAGMEFALTDTWSAKAEYMYFDLGSANYTVDNGLRVQGDTHGSSVRVGVNYHFGQRCCEAPLK